MSTIASRRPLVGPAPAVPPDWIPTPLYRLTVEQYEAIADAGILTAGDKVHLINGYLVEKMTHKPPHAVADELCGEAIRLTLPAGWTLRSGKPVRIPGLASEPEPDRCVVRGGIRDYVDRHPEPNEIAMIVEVPKASLAQDRNMAGVYGRARIAAYWIINLIDRQVEVYSNPGPAGYATLEVLAPGHVLSVVIDHIEVGQIAVEDILP
jgi:Uma2 family endonuclease